MSQEQPPKPTNEQSNGKIIQFPLSEYMRARQQHPAGKLGKKPVEQTLEELGQDNDSDGPEIA